MSERGNRDGAVRRSSYRKSLSETSLPPQYLAQLEEKRKQLDESIHKYIAAKEREYKLFEKDVRQQHKAEQNGDAVNGTSSKRRSSLESSQGENHTVMPESERSPAVDALLESSSRRDTDSRTGEADDVGLHDRSNIAGLKDRRASLEREKDFVGVFTPEFLPALECRDSSKLERTSSAPSAVQSTSTADKQDAGGPIERAYSDSAMQAMQAQPKRPSPLALVQRTSSSGSSVDGKLASAMKRSQPPKRKRVSLAVGDAIVAPSDSVPLSLSQHSSSSHSRIRFSAPDRGSSTLTKELAAPPDALGSADTSALQTFETVVLDNTVQADKEERSEQLAAITPKPPLSRVDGLKTGSSKAKLDADGDLFGLEEEDDDENQAIMDDISLEDEMHEAEGDVIMSEDVMASDSQELDPTGMRYDPTSGFIQEPADGTDSAVPYLAFGPGSSVASQQPTQPGFRRPSVVDDPVYRGANYRAAERNAVENEIYGSSFNRPSSKSSFSAGSLGESYMAKHAEEMMKARMSKQEAQVRT